MRARLTFRMVISLRRMPISCGIPAPRRAASRDERQFFHESNEIPAVADRRYSLFVVSNRFFSMLLEDAKLFCQTSSIDDSHAVGHLSGFVSDYPFDSRRSCVVETWRYRAAIRQSAPCGTNHR